MWYEEVSDYDFAKGNAKNGQVVGHFTQIVWKGTSQVGFGLAVAQDGRNKKYYCVGNYKAPGNYRGQYTSNVFPYSTSTNSQTTQQWTTQPETTLKDELLTAKPTVTQESSTTPTSTGTSVSADCLAKFRSEMLSIHNKFRSKHQVGDLEEIASIDKAAQDFADTVSEGDELINSGAVGYGENSASFSGSRYNLNRIRDCQSKFILIKSSTFLKFFLVPF
jgi:hypothetical protein